jgi:hypothetical protein
MLPLSPWEEAVLLAFWRDSVVGQWAPDLTVFPDDDAFLFDYGCLHEGLMAPGARVASALARLWRGIPVRISRTG